jgi:aspartate 4-decarboxylase
VKQRLNKRYSSLSTEPEKIRFIDRMVAESRCICLNHTAGLSLPQQMQMLLFSTFALLDKKNAYAKRCREICQDRLADLYKGMGLELKHDPLCAAYYRELDLEVWGQKVLGPEFMEFVKSRRSPLDLFFRLARDFHTVLLNGSGFGGPPWSVRVSLANLNDEEYVQIGRHLAQICSEAAAAWMKKTGGDGARFARNEAPRALTESAKPPKAETRRTRPGVTSERSRSSGNRSTTKRSQRTASAQRTSRR